MAEFDDWFYARSLLDWKSRSPSPGTFVRGKMFLGRKKSRLLFRRCFGPSFADSIRPYDQRGDVGESGVSLVE